MNDFNLCYDKKYIIFYITHRKFQCLNCNNFYNICPCVRSVKIRCLLSLFQNENRTKNSKILLKNNCINNSVINGLK